MSAPAPTEPSRLDVDDDVLGRALDLVRAREGLDLSGYRRPTLTRRLRNRMIAAGVRDARSYLDRLAADPAEGARLVERLTIKVSRFFRNAESYGALARALRDELARAPRPLAAWCAGCARGEEAYSLAIVLAELGQPEGGAPRVVATDVDPAALAAARAPAYDEAALAELPGALRGRWLEPAGPGRSRPVAGILRRTEFLRHDVTAGTPPAPGRFDLVSCRNTLIYFDAALRTRALRTLLAGLAPGGLLWLGEAEWPPAELGPALVPLDRKARLFRRAHAGGADA
jgi:chemotaxis methyl-accepting protein methylase